MKLLLENWKKYLTETTQMSMFPDAEERWRQLGGVENFYNSWIGRRFGEDERRGIEKEIDDMPQDEFDQLLARLNQTIEYQSKEYYDGEIPDEKAAAIRLWQVNKWRKNK